MSKKMKKSNGIKNYVGISLGMLAFVLTVSTVAVAYSGQNNGTVIENQTVQGDYVGSSSEEAVFGSGVGGRVTIDDYEIGATGSVQLDFSAGATTTPGGLARLVNGREAKVCTSVELDISTADTTGGRLGTGSPFDFSVSTSTASNALPASGPSLIASTTNATGTTALLDGVTNKGTGNNVAGQSWIWGAGEYILAQFDSIAGDAATSSTDYTGYQGRLYVECHVR